jgi:hypothetical protein
MPSSSHKSRPEAVNRMSVSSRCIPEFALRHQDLKLRALPRLTSFGNHNSGISQELTNQEQAKTSSLTIAEFEYFFFFIKGNSLTIILIDQDKGFS